MTRNTEEFNITLFFLFFSKKGNHKKKKTLGINKYTHLTSTVIKRVIKHTSVTNEIHKSSSSSSVTHSLKADFLTHSCSRSLGCLFTPWQEESASVLTSEMHLFLRIYLGGVIILYPNNLQTIFTILLWKGLFATVETVGYIIFLVKLGTVLKALRL